MNNGSRYRQVLCVLMALLLLLILCAMGHDCHREHCPVCMLTASFRLTLGLVALVYHLFCPKFIHLFMDRGAETAGAEENLVALKVKLSD
jgi:hypothetical protein